MRSRPAAAGSSSASGSGRDRTASVSSRSRAAIRSATPASSASCVCSQPASGTTGPGGGVHMYHQVYDPVGGSLGLSSIFAVLPLITLFVLLGGVKMKAQWAALISLAVAIVVAIAVYSMPVGQTFDSAAE